MALSAQHVHLAVHATHQERQRDARLSPVTPRGHRRLRESYAYASRIGKGRSWTNLSYLT
ncbi:hypothetical protein PR003_g32232 [Phytophthora rubi]|uniref:Uncharacterized protein n=1 Tax=Phytophthora rubi TaxID=129364 RepID=A0A6A4B6F6_9STRA|nr:hypothetical protein PR003_g32232 [Phytophthora rubi]